MMRAVVRLAAALGGVLAGCSRNDDLIATFNATNAGGGGEPATVLPSPCALPEGAPPALSRYEFEDAGGSVTLHDERGLADAQMMGGGFALTAGPAGCGNALALGSGALFGVIPNLSAWDLGEGSVDFWVRVPDAANGAYGILGRDHQGTDLPGHLSIWLTPDRTITARLQGESQLATHCSEQPLAPGQWLRVGINFGAAGSELWVDGKLAQRTGDPRIETVVPECGGTTPDGIAGNEQPWVLGYDTSRSGDMLDGLSRHFDGGAIDALELSAVRRNFQTP